MWGMNLIVCNDEEVALVVVAPPPDGVVAAVVGVSWWEGDMPSSCGDLLSGDVAPRLREDVRPGRTIAGDVGVGPSCALAARPRVMPVPRLELVSVVFSSGDADSVDGLGCKGPIPLLPCTIGYQPLSPLYKVSSVGLSSSCVPRRRLERCAASDGGSDCKGGLFAAPAISPSEDLDRRRSEGVSSLEDGLARWSRV